eukprot:Rmarinus@m.13105
MMRYKKEWDNTRKDVENLHKTYFDEYTQATLNLQNELITSRRQYAEETRKRRDLLKQLEELKGNIRVFCRMRPFDGPSITVTHTSNSIETTDPSHRNVHNFEFDHVFGPDDTQEHVFASIGNFIQSVVDGYNVCIFAYGQTGSGKTHTMRGTDRDPGLYGRTFKALFDDSQRGGSLRLSLDMSMVEVYNEVVRDLLVDPNKCSQTRELRQNHKKRAYVEGLTRKKVTTLEEAMSILTYGESNRAVGSTNLNERSSRSHLILTLTVHATTLLSRDGKDADLYTTKGTLNLIDLAGSERVTRSGVEGKQLEETKKINSSLAFLKNVLTQLQHKKDFVSYRDSKLTALLQDSLSGESKTAMFLHVTPEEASYRETMSSLRFGSQVKEVELGTASRKCEVNTARYRQMAEIIRKQDNELRICREKLGLSKRLPAHSANTHQVATSEVNRRAFDKVNEELMKSKEKNQKLTRELNDKSRKEDDMQKKLEFLEKRVRCIETRRTRKHSNRRHSAPLFASSLSEFCSPPSTHVDHSQPHRLSGTASEEFCTDHLTMHTTLTPRPSSAAAVMYDDASYRPAPLSARETPSRRAFHDLSNFTQNLAATAPVISTSASCVSQSTSVGTALEEHEATPVGPVPGTSTLGDAACQVSRLPQPQVHVLSNQQAEQVGQATNHYHNNVNQKHNTRQHHSARRSLSASFVTATSATNSTRLLDSSSSCSSVQRKKNSTQGATLSRAMAKSISEDLQASQENTPPRSSSSQRPLSKSVSDEHPYPIKRGILLPMQRLSAAEVLGATG